MFAIGAIGGGRDTSSAYDTDSANKENNIKSADDDHALTAAATNVLGGHLDKQLFTDKPMQKRILRKVKQFQT